MKPIPSLTTAVLCAALALSHPAFALRAEHSDSGLVRGGLEEALSAGLEEGTLAEAIQKLELAVSTDPASSIEQTRLFIDRARRAINALTEIELPDVLKNQVKQLQRGISSLDAVIIPRKVFLDDRRDAPLASKVTGMASLRANRQFSKSSAGQLREALQLLLRDLRKYAAAVLSPKPATGLEEDLVGDIETALEILDSILAQQPSKSRGFGEDLKTDLGSSLGILKDPKAQGTRKHWGEIIIRARGDLVRFIEWAEEQKVPEHRQDALTWLFGRYSRYMEPASRGGRAPGHAGLEERQLTAALLDSHTSRAAVPQLAGLEEYSSVGNRIKNALRQIKALRGILGLRGLAGSALFLSLTPMEDKLSRLRPKFEKNIEELVSYFDDPSRNKPTETQALERQAIASVAEIPEQAIVFLDPTDLESWLMVGVSLTINRIDFRGLKAVLRNSPINGVHVVRSDKSGGVRRMIFVRNDLTPAASLKTLSHEAAHYQQSLKAMKVLYSGSVFSEFYRIMVEGMQRRKEAFLFQQALRRLQSSRPSLRTELPQSYLEAPKSYRLETEFINLLAQRFDFVRVTYALEALWSDGERAPLRSALGPTRYDALGKFFPQWAIYSETKPNERFGLLKFRLATALVLDPRIYRRQYTRRLLGLIKLLQKQSDLLPQAFYEKLHQESPVMGKVIELAEAFVRGMSKKEFQLELHRILNGGSEESVTTGLEERMPGWLKAVRVESEFTRTVADLRAAAALRQPTAVLFAPELVPGKTTEDQRALLTGLEEKIRAAFTWPDSVPLQLDLREAKAGLEQAGYRTVEVLLQPDSQVRFLPESALPVVIQRALASGRSALFIDPLFYAGLEEILMPDVLNALADFSA